MKNLQKGNYEKEICIFNKAGGILRTTHALRYGIHPRKLYAMRNDGIITRLSHGVYRLADKYPLENPDFVTVAMRAPQSVICLISALSFHGITTQIPHEVYIAVTRTKSNVSWAPKIDYPPVRIYHFKEDCFIKGIENHVIDEVPVRIYCPEKTIADCFKYRNKIGLDTAIEALKLFKDNNKHFNISKILHFANICRVAKVIKPYLEVLL